MAQRRTVNGMHLPNLGYAWDIEQMLRIAHGQGAVTILDFQMFKRKHPYSDGAGDDENDYWYRKLRWGWPPQGIPPAPERLIHIRLFQANWADHDPKVLAGQAVELLAHWESSTRDGQPYAVADLWEDPYVCVSPCNEQNLEGPLDLRHNYQYHAEWQLRFWDEVDRRVPNRRALSALGAWAFGHDVVPDVPDSEYQVPAVRELCNRVDLLCTHPYANFSFPGGGFDTADPEMAAYYYLLRDFRPEGWRDTRQPGRPHDIGGILAQYPNPPLLISESGTFAHGDAGRNGDTLAAMRLLLETAAESDRVLGVTWFIWNSGGEHAGNRIWPNGRLRAGMEAMPGYWTNAVVPLARQGGGPVTDRLSDMLRAQFGDRFVDLRASLPQDPNGPNGAFGVLPAGNIEAMILHHSAGGYAQSWYDIASYHVNTRRFAGIGYHLGVRDGRVYYLGDIGTARAHVAGQNHRYVGVVVPGNYETDIPKQADTDALRRLGAVLRSYTGRPLPWKGHRDVAQTLCPGRTLYAIMPSLDGAPPNPPQPGVDVAALKRAAEAEHAARGIRYNPEAALARAMQNDGVWPTTNEFDAAGAVAQRAEGPTGAWVYWWHEGRVGKARI